MQIRNSADEYRHIYVFSVRNMRNKKLKEVRTQWNDSRFFLGRNRVMQVALGRSPSDEYRKNLHCVSDRLLGEVGLLFTNRPPAEVRAWFDNYSELEYARAGFCATDTVTLPAGPMPAFPHSIEPHLRSLGLPTALVDGAVTLLREHVVCKRGEVLKPEQARILVRTGARQSGHARHF